MDYHKIVEDQRAHFRSGATRLLAARRAAVEKYQQLVAKHKDELKKAIFNDLHRDATYEVMGTLAQTKETLENLEAWNAPKKLDTSTTPLNTETDDLYLVREPLGVCLTILPWNFPLICAAPVIQALAAGNTVILKPSEMAPTFATTIEKIINENFDNKLFIVVNGGVPEVTELLKERFDHIFYTGNPVVGKIIMAAAAKNLTPVTLELGGKNPCFIADDADITDAAAKIVNAKMLNCGQICINPDYIMTTEDARPKVIEALKEAWEKQGVLKENPAYARIVNGRHFDRLSTLIHNTKGNIVFKAKEEANKDEKFLPPHIFEVQKGDELLKEEIFGPITPVLTVKNLDEAIDYVKDNEKPLAAYIFSKCKDNCVNFILNTSSGGVTVNDVHGHAFAPGCPFGGVGNSGMGRINGKYSYDMFTHEKTCLLREGVGKLINKELH